MSFEADNVRWTRHALDRVREFYPGAEAHDLQEVLCGSEHVAPEVAATLRGMGHVRDTDTGDLYLHPERTGLFVMARTPEQVTVVTFLRFYSVQQHQLAVRLYGPGKPVTATGSCTWAKMAQPEPPSWHARKIKVSQGARKIVGTNTGKVRAMLDEGREPTDVELDAVRGWEGELVWCLDHSDQVLMVVDLGDRVSVGLMPARAQRRAHPPVVHGQALPSVGDHRGTTVLDELGVEIRHLRVARPLLERLGADKSTAGRVRAWVRNRVVDLSQAREHGLAHACLDGVWQDEVFVAWLAGDLKVWIARQWTPDGQDPEWMVLHCPPHQPDHSEIAKARDLASRGWVVIAPLWLPDGDTD